MTREESIEIIQKLIGRFKSDSRTYKALEMAIQALSQEPTNTWSIKDVADTFKKHGLIREQEPCDDAISRDAVYSILNEYHIGEEEIESAMDECQNLTVNAITSDVSFLPSVTQKSESVTEFADRCRECGARYGKLLEQNSGKWEDLHRCWVCSECGQQTHIEHKYCPNCGAKMESEEQTE